MLLLEQLPAESRFARARSGAWTLDQYMLAAVFDAVQWGNYQRNGGRGKRPKPIPRPGEGPDRETFGGASVMTIDEARAWSEKRRLRLAALADTKGGDDGSRAS